jgi:hypothetical protein
MASCVAVMCPASWRRESNIRHVSLAKAAMASAVAFWECVIPRSLRLQSNAQRIPKMEEHYTPIMVINSQILQPHTCRAVFGPLQNFEHP